MEVPTAGLELWSQHSGNGRIVQYEGLHSGGLCAGILIAAGGLRGHLWLTSGYKDAREKTLPDAGKPTTTFLRRLGSCGVALRAFIWNLFPGCFRLRVTGASCRLLDNGVDLATDENRHASQVKPQHQNDDCAQGAIHHTVGVVKVEIRAEQKGNQQPQKRRRSWLPGPASAAVCSCSRAQSSISLKG